MLCFNANYAFFLQISTTSKNKVSKALVFNGYTICYAFVGSTIEFWEGFSKTTINRNLVSNMVGLFILKCAILGLNYVVGAGSVVSGTFPDNVIIAGNPAKIIKENSI